MSRYECLYVNRDACTFKRTGPGPGNTPHFPGGYKAAIPDPTDHPDLRAN